MNQQQVGASRSTFVLISDGSGSSRDDAAVQDAAVLSTTLSGSLRVEDHQLAQIHTDLLWIIGTLIVIAVFTVFGYVHFLRGLIEIQSFLLHHRDEP